MSSVKIILKNKPNQKGAYPLAIQIIKDRRKSLIFTGQYVDKKAWDGKNQKVRKSHPNSIRVNNFLQHKIAEVNAKIIESELEGKTQSATSLKTEVRSDKSNSFFRVADNYLAQLYKSKKFNQHAATRPTYRHFREFLNGNDISVKDITPTLLRNYQAYLSGERNVGKRTIMNNLVNIRTVLNIAAQENPS